MHLFQMVFVDVLVEEWLLSAQIQRRFIPGSFFYYFLTTSWRKVVESNIINGATVDRIPLKKFPEFKVQFPALDAQERIASILSAYDDLIENNRRRIQLLEQAARLLYREWFVRLHFPGHEHVKIKDGVPEEWEKKKLSDLCEEVHESVKPDAIEPDTPYIGLEHIPRRSISLSEWGLAEDVISNKNSFHEGDILFGKIRTVFSQSGDCFH